MTRKQRYEWMLDYFRKKMPEVQTELEFGSAVGGGYAECTMYGQAHQSGDTGVVP